MVELNEREIEGKRIKKGLWGDNCRFEGMQGIAENAGNEADATPHCMT